MDERDKIIVYTAFDTTVEANLAKTKLDAYGIPCFLSDENFVNLYPIRNEVFPGTRLHIFESDAARVSELLNETPKLETDGEIQCPVCKSKKVSLVTSRKGWFAWLLASILFALIPQKRVFHCIICGTEFDYKDT